MKKFKQITLYLLTLGISVNVWGQESESLIMTDTTWQKEVFKFPIGFAQEINYQGYEEAFFPANWAKKDSIEFWSYIFVWKVNEQPTVSPHKLETNLKTYFKGLMENDAEVKLYKGEKKNFYRGTIKTTDRFFTKEEMTLNVTIEHHYCTEEKQSLILFRFSPRNYTHKVWNQLNELHLSENACQNH